MVGITQLVIVEGFHVTIILNGFPVFYKIDNEAEQVSSKLAPYLKQGGNQIEGFLAGESVKNDADEKFFMGLRKAEANQAPADGISIFEYNWDSNLEEHKFIHDGTLKSIFKHTFIVDEPMGPWAWESATPVKNRKSAENEIYEFITKLAKALREVNLQVVLALIELRNREIGAALGMVPERMRQGFSQGLRGLSSAADFRVDLPEREEVHFWWEAEGRWCVARRNNKHDAIQITSDGITQPFEMIIGQLNGKWTILR